MLYENFFIVKFAIAVPEKVKLVVEKKRFKHTNNMAWQPSSFFGPF